MTNHNVHALNAIAQRLVENGDSDARNHALIALDALAAAGYHILTAPKVTVDPPEGSPEHEAILNVSRHYAMDERSIKRTLSATLDNEVLSAAMIVSPHEAQAYRGDERYQEHVARKMGIEFMAEVWKRLAPDTAVEP